MTDYITNNYELKEDLSLFDQLKERWVNIEKNSMH